MGGYQLAAWPSQQHGWLLNFRHNFSAEHTDVTQIFECSHFHFYLVTVCWIVGAKCGPLSVHLGSVSVWWVWLGSARTHRRGATVNCDSIHSLFVQRYATPRPHLVCAMLYIIPTMRVPPYCLLWSWDRALVHSSPRLVFKNAHTLTHTLCTIVSLTFGYLPRDLLLSSVPRPVPRTRLWILLSSIPTRINPFRTGSDPCRMGTPVPD
jgi:hypothetical protein